MPNNKEKRFIIKVTVFKVDLPYLVVTFEDESFKDDMHVMKK